MSPCSVFLFSGFAGDIYYIQGLMLGNMSIPISFFSRRLGKIKSKQRNVNLFIGVFCLVDYASCPRSSSS